MYKFSKILESLKLERTITKGLWLTNHLIAFYRLLKTLSTFSRHHPPFSNFHIFISIQFVFMSTEKRHEKNVKYAE